MSLYWHRFMRLRPVCDRPTCRVRLTQQPFAYLFGRRERAKLFHHYVDKVRWADAQLLECAAGDALTLVVTGLWWLRGAAAQPCGGLGGAGAGGGALLSRPRACAPAHHELLLTSLCCRSMCAPTPSAPRAALWMVRWPFA